MQIEINEKPPIQGHTNLALFHAAFRPLFLLAGIAATLMVPAWLAIHHGLTAFPHHAAPVQWHSHEMIYGFAVAALGGFLLTAVANWTGTPFLSGKPLMLLAGAWVLGRLAVLLGGASPPLVTAALDLLYLPGVIAALAKPLMRADQPGRNRLFLLLLGVLAAGNLLVHLEWLGWTATAQAGIRLGLYALLTAMAIIGGRIIPSFTVNGLRMNRIVFQPTFRPWVERLAAPLVVLTGLADVVLPETPIVAVAALAGGLVHLLRLSGWGGHKTGRVPLLWVLHLGYGWLGVGLVLRGLSALSPLVPSSAALHALTVGAAGMLILGVMTRAALGHSGRPMVLAPPIVWAYGAIMAAALLRVLAPMAIPAWTAAAVVASGAAWTLGFGLFVLVYAPMLWRPRADGRPG